MSHVAALASEMPACVIIFWTRDFPPIEVVG